MNIINMEEKITNKINKKLLALQLFFIALAILFVLIYYPRSKVDVDGSFARFNSINSNVIVVADNPDFINPKYIDFKDANNFSLKLKPGRYYYKSYNNFIESFDKKFEIKSEVGLMIDEKEEDLVNIGNVKINVTKNNEGRLIGSIILEPDDKSKLDEGGDLYVGKET